MSELRDPAIKLFGHTIPLPESPPTESEAMEPADETAHEDSREAELSNSRKTDPSGEVEQADMHHEDEDGHQIDGKEDVGGAAEVTMKTKGDRCGEEKVLKKPDQILPCPRCNSMETKFCYFNNYNINQPRYFCKNCQRYWTAGGTMRNVPVGAGKRKSKYSTSHCRKEGLTVVCRSSNLPCSDFRPAKGYETILKFGPDLPLCKSMSTALNINEQRGTDENSCTSSGKDSNHVEIRSSESTVHDGKVGVAASLPQASYFGAPFISWNFGWNSNIDSVIGEGTLVAQDSNGFGTIAWMPAAAMSVPTLCMPSMQPRVPFSFVPPLFWSLPNEMPNMLWNGANGCVSPSSSLSDSRCSSNGSPTLGKHSRDPNFHEVQKKDDKYLWVPKTLRIDDPEEAAKSSIWATLGIKHDEAGISGSFHSAAATKGHRASDPAHILRANPAAFSRSQAFQESS